MKFGFNRPSGFRGEVFENVDIHTHIHTYGRQRPTYYKLTNEPKGWGGVGWGGVGYGRVRYDGVLYGSIW